MFEKPISINYLKKSPYFGSYEGVSFAFIKKEDILEAYLYPGPFNFEKTPDDKKIKAEFGFSDEGYGQALAWMNEHFSDFDPVPHGKRFANEVINKILCD